mgnify:CR=1 FL=1
MRRERAAKIISTLGPSSTSPEVIANLFEAGADVFRLNFSHGQHEEHKELYDSIRKIEADYNRPIGIIADLQGPKIRVGNFVGKKIFDQTGEFVSIKVVKGKVNDVYSGEALNHGVDGISGATVTSRGVSDFLKRDLLRYGKYMKNNRTN